MNARLANLLRGVPGVLSTARRFRRRRHEEIARQLVAAADGRAARLPQGFVYEATMRCNLRCRFCYVGDLLNIEGQWRQEMPVDSLRAALPEHVRLEVSLTGGEIFARNDIEDVLELFRAKGYACGYLTTNGTLIDEHRAAMLARLAGGGFLKHISVSIDGPADLHDAARGMNGTFARAAAGIHRLRSAAAAARTPMRVSINTTIARESVQALDRMAEVAAEVGVGAIGVNHLMFATPDEATETARLLDVAPSAITTYVTTDPDLDPVDVREKLQALAAACRERAIRFDVRPKVGGAIIERYYTPNAPLEGRCLYPFLHARIGLSGTMYFCPFIRIQVGDLRKETLEDAWNGPEYVRLRRRLLEETLFPVCRRCCKVELERAC